MNSIYVTQNNKHYGMTIKEEEANWAVEKEGVIGLAAGFEFMDAISLYTPVCSETVKSDCIANRKVLCIHLSTNLPNLD